MPSRKIAMLTLAAAAALACQSEQLTDGARTSSSDLASAKHGQIGAELPFLGSLTTIETNVIAPPNLLVDGTGQGSATHLGQYTATYTVVVDLATGTSTGSITLTASNGDQLSATIIGVGEEIEPGVASLTEVATITGGTGRFAGATGTFTIRRIIRFDGAGGASASGSFAGHIILTG